MTTSTQRLDKIVLDKIVTETADDWRVFVAGIEMLPPTTQNHYGRYLDILTHIGDGNEMVTRITALALIEAGANEKGVNAALRITGF